MVSLPIPTTKWESFKCYFVQYDLKDGKGEYKNKKINVKIKDSERLSDLRLQIEKQYGIPASSYLISWVSYQ